MKIGEDKDGTPSSMQEVDSNNQVVTRVKKTAQIERNIKTENNNMVATKRRRSKRKKVEKLTESKDNDDPNNFGIIDDGDDDYNDDEEKNANVEIEDRLYDSARKTKHHQKRRKRQKKDNVNTPPKKLKPDEIQHKCPHCERIFKTKLGLRYHINNYVCRIEKCTDPRIIKAKKRNSETTLQNRTCPYCKTVFANCSGRNYHVTHKVCQKTNALVFVKARVKLGKDPQVRSPMKVPVRPKTKSQAKSKVTLWRTLSPGDQFDTSFGIVEVVKDDRAVPTANVPKNIFQLSRAYGKSKSYEERRETTEFTKQSGKLRVRRNNINALYEKKGKANRRSIFQAYFDGDPEYMKVVLSANNTLVTGSECNQQGSESSHNKQKGGKAINPRDPPESFPDRIVECVTVTDQRSYALGEGKDVIQRNSKCQGTMFLQRRLLTKLYNKDDLVRHCPHCGKNFTSLAPWKTHVERKACKEKAVFDQKKREEIKTRIEREMHDLIRFPTIRKYPMKRNFSGKRKKRNRKPERSIYPEVALGLGFKLVTKPLPAVDNGGNVVIQEDKQPLIETTYDPFVEPSLVLQNLQLEFENQQRKANDQKYGGMYPAVFKALKFKLPRKKRAIKNVKKVIRRKQAVKLKSPPAPKPIPPAIDTRALADEADSGRYPSISRYKGDTHDKLCVLCKMGGNLLCCSFCHRAEHLDCIREKFTIKTPDVGEDIMCHKCIQIIIGRRARAEKRRLQKQQVFHEDLKQKDHNSENGTKIPAKGKEYEYMTSTAHEVNELVELLKDSQLRLRQSIETTTMSKIRRGLISGTFDS